MSGYASIEDRRAYQRAYYERNKEAIKAKTKAYASTRRQQYCDYVKARRVESPRTTADRRAEAARARARAGNLDAQVILYRAQPKPPKPCREPLHEAHVRRLRDDAATYYAWRYKNDPEFMLRERTRTSLRKIKHRKDIDESMRQALKGKTSGKSFAKLVGYTLSDLRIHLERQFTAGMSWATFTKDGWHIDHIIPRRLFDVSTDDGVRACWALSNLRPLSAAANLRKGARLDFLV